MEKCEKCKRESSDLHWHHIIARKDGGTNDKSNLMRLCSDCHFKLHHPNKTDGDIAQFNADYNSAVRENIFSEGWGILPRKIALDSNVSDFSKILYSEISSLCAERGYCWASNEYLAQKFNKSARTISRSIAEIEKYLIIEDRGGCRRRIFVHTLMQDKQRQKPSQKCLTKRDINVQQNSISNKINNNTAKTSFAPSSFEEKPKTESSPIIDFREEMERLQNDKRRDLQVVGLYMEFRKATLQKTIHNKAQLSMFIKRHLKSAGTIVKAEYTDDQIVEFFEETNQKNKDIDWTIETVIKQITK